MTARSSTTSAIGLFGGTFDPIHFGHLRLATELAQAFGLDHVDFIPAGQPYQRAAQSHAPGPARLEMVRRAIAGNPRFGVDDRELRREGPTYTFDTLREIRAETGPTTPIVFLAGSDAFARINTWHRWSELFDLAHFAVAIRADDHEWGAKGTGAFPREVRPRITLERLELLGSPAGKVMTFAMTPLAISASALRARVAQGASIRDLTPDPVVDYIRDHRLYSSPS